MLFEDRTEMELQEILLYSTRHGDIPMVQELLDAKKAEKITLNISCRGKNKSNFGWTPLHLASYFGHLTVVELLLDHGADINAINDAGDTALHKAAFIGREDLVLVLLGRGADVSVPNGEGLTPREVGRDPEVCKLLAAAEMTEARRREEALLAGARQGDMKSVAAMLKQDKPPNINCVDAQGNTCLHCASYRGHKEVAVLLLQNGIDTSIRNNRGQTALEMARDAHMRQVLCVQPLRQLQKTATRFEGQLVKRSRFLGWKPIWAVLERGVLTYYGSRADAWSGSKRRGCKCLDSGARVVLPPDESHDTSSFSFRFSDGTMHRLGVVDSGEGTEVGRQKWINAFQEHVAFSSHYLSQGQVLYDSDEEEGDLKPLGSMEDSLQTAGAHHQMLQQHLGEATSVIESLSPSDWENLNNCDAAVNILAALKKFQILSETAGNMMCSLGHCLTLFQQQEEVRMLQVRQEQEKCRVLEEALHVLAKEHHELEQSVVGASQPPSPRSLRSPTPLPFDRSTSHQSLRHRRSPRFYDTSDDEFYDAFDADSDSDTLVTAASPTSDSDTLVSFPSPTPSDDFCLSPGPIPKDKEPDDDSSWRVPRNRNTLTLRGCYRGRQKLPVAMFNRNDFSIWSVLKNCIGKELSKITMPVVFNEPLSFLQRMVEYMEYAHLLKRAAQEQDPVDRMRYVAAFAVSALAFNWERLGKPFNPLLGETYELEREDFRVVCEQVSHHPPVSAFHADGADFHFHGSIHPKLKFWGKSVEIQPKGTVTVEFPSWGEAYTWTNVNCCVHNIIVGKLWIEQYGTMEVINQKTGHRAILTFKPAGWYSKDLHRVEGFVTDKHKKKLFFLYGKWTEFIKSTDIPSYEDRDNDQRSGVGKNTSSPAHTPKKVLAKLNSLKVSPFRSSSLSENVGCSSAAEDTPPPPTDVPDGEIPKSDSTYSIDIPNSVLLWEADPRPPNTAEYYQFTLFAMSLNEMEEGMPEKLCPTDCRLRPDIRKLEEGDIDGAAAEKNRLEEKQREARKSRKSKKGADWSPRWFCQGTNPYTKQEDWLYSGGYWDRNFIDIPDIF
ncbi:oxysterol-binding protein-related protein 1-like isoform X2 [Hetaerina americana]|uniref:oxysterol-binding protein-related protein 1-like isoform X2 n=1 Tax=Hetaerina americana TaxID=62018 RepID=UPI003A7F271D